MFHARVTDWRLARETCSLLTISCFLPSFKFILRTLSKVTEEQCTDDAPLKERLLEL